MGVTGVLHVGGNFGQEAEVYDACGCRKVIWVEGFDEFYEGLLQHIAQYPGQEAHNVMVSDEDGEKIVFRIASNTGSSTALNPTEAFDSAFKGIQFDRVEERRAQRLDMYFERGNVDLTGINVLVLDVEGYELKVLKSLGDRIAAFEWIVCEVAFRQIFQGGPLMSDIDAYVARFGFRRIEVKGGLASGDALYRRTPGVTGVSLGNRLSAALYRVLSASGLLQLKRVVGRIAK